MSRSTGQSTFYTYGCEQTIQQHTDDTSHNLSKIPDSHGAALNVRRQQVILGNSKKPINVKSNSFDESASSMSPTHDWSLVNNPDFSVHSFEVPQRQNHGGQHTEINDVNEDDNSLHLNVQNLNKLQIQERLSYTDVPADNDIRNSWHVPSRESISEATNHPSSLPHSLLSSVQTVTNGHGNYEPDGSSLPSPRKDDTESEQSDVNVKTSLMSFWNNVKNEREWQKIEHDLGKNCVTQMDNFKIDFASKMWFTYRKDFSPLPYIQLTTDMGWGCMLRTGQMMLAQALVMHLLGREWRSQIHRGQGDLIHKKILQFFCDKDSKECPFSIHKLVRIGKKFDKLPGDWYGPSSAAHVLRDAMSSPNDHPMLSNLCVYVAQDCTIYIGDVLELCTKTSSQSVSSTNTSSELRDAEEQPTVSHKPETWKAVIILIPVRLGGVDFNSVYSPCIKTVLANSQCLGVIGGKPKHSLYFVGWQDDKLIYLDPHFCQDFIDCDVHPFSTDSFHCSYPRKMSISKMDPSCTIGFYCKTKEDFFTFIKEAKKIVAPPMEKLPCPMFVFQDGKSEDSINSDTSEQKADRILKVCHYDSEGRKRPPKNSDDFVFL